MNPETKKYYADLDKNLHFTNASIEDLAAALPGRIQKQLGSPIGGTQARPVKQSFDHPRPQRKPYPPGVGPNAEVPFGGYKKGGVVTNPLPDQFHSSGLFNASSSGREDVLSRAVPPEGYVFPADFVSGLGDGNTESGKSILDRLFGGGPSGTKVSTARGSANFPRQKFAQGGVPVVVAGGEYYASPEQLAKKFGSLSKAHQAMDKWVLSQRAKNVKTLKKLPAPKGSHK